MATQKGTSVATEGQGGSGAPAASPEPKVEATPKVFTQEELNTIAARIRREEREKFSDYEELKGKAKRLDDAERAQLSETQQLRQDLAKAQRQGADADARIASAMIDSQIRVKASEAGFINPSAVLRLINRNGISYTEEGGVAGVDRAIAELKQSDSYLVAPAGGRAPNLNAAPGKPGQSRALTEDQRDAARRMNMTEAEYAKGLK